MRIREVMTQTLITVVPDETVSGAHQLMQKHRIRHLLVVDADQLAGIVTDRDIRLNLPSQATSLSVWEVHHLLAKLTVGAVMTRAVISIGPERDAREAARLMLEHTIGALPVTDGGRLIGIVTETDLLRVFVSCGADEARERPSASRSSRAT
jgi:acetoin utilization protein AcuB